MAATFSQTLRSFAAESRQGSLFGIVLALGLLGAWGAWFFRAEVTVVETSEAARLEVARAAHAVDAPVAGRIASSRLVLGLAVAAGDILVEIDSQAEKKKLDETTARLSAIAPEIEALRRTLAAEDQAIASDRGATVVALDQARARQQEAEIGRRLASEESLRAGKLLDGGAISELERMRKQSEAERQGAATSALALDVDRQNANQRTRESQSRARIEDLLRDLATLEGTRATTTATIDVLRYEIDRRTIRAPVAGRIGDVAELRPGAYVREGGKLGAVVPTGDIRIVAEFLPAAALGRIRGGQHARVRLEGYPWIEYGTLGAKVTLVGSEVRDGRIRVELAVSGEPGALPLEHGLPGRVEVEVERVTPAMLVLRAIGHTLGRRATRTPAPAGPADDPREARP